MTLCPVFTRRLRRTLFIILHVSLVLQPQWRFCALALLSLAVLLSHLYANPFHSYRVTLWFMPPPG